jgi:hypothetical protein
MPTLHNLYAVDFVETLKKKYESGTYKEMVGTFVLVVFQLLKLWFAPVLYIKEFA